ncbi:MAG: DUF4172 domain-containing protein [Sphaerochaeta sp.]|nr:DUF4172 domain-containing protein [Sphaerochaeta sp.]
MQFIWSNPNWPAFTYDVTLVERYWQHFSVEARAIDMALGLIETAPRQHITARTLADEIVSSLAIEGERVSYASVHSSLCSLLEIPTDMKGKADRHSENLATLALDAATNSAVLSTERLQNWHALLFANQAGLRPKRRGEFRTGPVFIVKHGKTVIYEGIPADRIDAEMDQLLRFITEDTSHTPMAKAAIASLWFAAIHPFEDGNGRISRAICEYVLTKELKSSHRSYSISAAILKHRTDYYRLLEDITAQSASLDVTSYLVWTITMAVEAIREALGQFKHRMRLSALMKNLDSSRYNSRQLSMLYKLADKSVEGKLTTAKWAKMNTCSPAAAARDLGQLVSEGFLYPSGDRGPQTGYLFDENILDRL